MLDVTFSADCRAIPANFRSPDRGPGGRVSRTWRSTLPITGTVLTSCRILRSAFTTSPNLLAQSREATRRASGVSTTIRSAYAHQGNEVCRARRQMLCESRTMDSSSTGIAVGFALQEFVNASSYPTSVPAESPAANRYTCRPLFSHHGLIDRTLSHSETRPRARCQRREPNAGNERAGWRCAADGRPIPPHRPVGQKTYPNSSRNVPAFT